MEWFGSGESQFSPTYISFVVSTEVQLVLALLGLSEFLNDVHMYCNYKNCDSL